MSGRRSSSDPFHVVGRSVDRLDGVAKVTGSAIYTSDLPGDRSTHATILRSSYAHARIRSVDAADALRQQGVLAVLTYQDLSGLSSTRFGHALKDRPILADGTVRYVGEPVCVVIAETERIAQDAVRRIDVEYEQQPAVMDVHAAIASGAPLVHDGEYEGGFMPGVPSRIGARGTNVVYHEHLEWGDVDRAMAGAARVVETTSRFPMAYHYAMEPYVALAEYDRSSGLSVTSSTQHPFMVRHDLAMIFGLPLSKVRVVVPYVGGGFGSKSWTKIEPIAAVCAWRVGRPVRLALTVSEAMLTTRMASAQMWIRTGVDNDGTIVAQEGTLHFDGGAYVDNSSQGVSRAAERILGPYRSPSARVDSYLVYTNTVPAGSFRGFGTTQAAMAAELQMDEIAHQLGEDPLELRLRNVATRGERLYGRTRPMDGDPPGNLTRTAAALNWNTSRGPRGRGGLGIALTASGVQSPPVSTALLRVHADGSVTLLSSSTEMGQGSETVLAQIAAEELEVPIDMVKVTRGDTSGTPFDQTTGASRSTTLQGLAVQAAARNTIERLRAMAREVTAGAARGRGVKRMRGGFQTPDGFLSWGDVITRYFRVPDCEVVGYGYVRATGDLASKPTFWEMTCAGARVSVDEETGVVSVTDLVILGDVGLAIHPAMTEGQDLGASMMGLGLALTEELSYDGEQLRNGSLLDYRVPRFSDTPERWHSVVIENRDGSGPFGVKGVGEGAVNPVPPAVLAALRDAVGVRLHEIPATPERVWRALRALREAGRTTPLRRS